MANGPAPSRRLRLLNWLLLHLEKPYLARENSIARARRRLRFAARFFLAPRATTWRETTLAGMACIEAAPQNPIDDAALLWFHGGAHVQGSRHTHRKMGQAIANYTRLRVLIPDYRLAPEHPFPAAWDDSLLCYRALLDAWPADRVFLGGDSSGAGLAFAILNMARSAGLPIPAGLIAFSPWVDLTLQSPTLMSNAKAEQMLPITRVPEITEMVLAGADPTDPRASPILGCFDAAPPAFVLVGAQEILLGDAETLAARYKAEGRRLTLQVWDCAPHVLPIFWGWVPEARAALIEAAGLVREVLGPPTD